MSKRADEMKRARARARAGSESGRMTDGELKGLEPANTGSHRSLIGL